MISAGKFEDENSGAGNIKKFFSETKIEPKERCSLSKDDPATEKASTSLEFQESEAIPEKALEAASTSGNLISKLFASKTLEEESSNISKEIETVKCEKCLKEVSPFEMPEHLDFHLAQELQQEIRRSDMENRQQNIPIKRKMVAVNSQNENTAKKQRNIKSFFQKR